MASSVSQTRWRISAWLFSLPSSWSLIARKKQLPSPLQVCCGVSGHASLLPRSPTTQLTRLLLGGASAERADRSHGRLSH